jgi:hypothetical protein
MESCVGDALRSDATTGQRPNAKKNTMKPPVTLITSPLLVSLDGTDSEWAAYGVSPHHCDGDDAGEVEPKFVSGEVGMAGRLRVLIAVAGPAVVVAAWTGTEPAGPGTVCVDLQGDLAGDAARSFRLERADAIL